MCTVPHSSELDYVFNTLVNKTPTAIALSRNIQDYWLSFVTSLTPNDGRGARRKCMHITARGTTLTRT